MTLLCYFYQDYCAPLPITVLSDLATPGVCASVGNEVGCTNPSGTSGNPNDMIACFNNSQTTLPFEVHALRFWIGTSAPLPDNLFLRIWSGSATTGPGTLLYEQEVPPGSYNIAENTIALDDPFEFSGQEFCAGVYSNLTNDGFRLVMETGDGLESRFLAPNCGAPFDTWYPVQATIGALEFCIEALVTDH